MKTINTMKPTKYHVESIEVEDSSLDVVWLFEISFAILELFVKIAPF